MKGISLVFLLTVAIVSCKPEPYDLETNFTIANESSHYVELTIYQGYFDFVYRDTTFYFDFGAKITYRYINIMAESPFGGGEDSAVIIFDGVRKITYHRNDGQPRNILDINSFTCKKASAYFSDYRYTITNEDFLKGSIIESSSYTNGVK